MGEKGRPRLGDGRGVGNTGQGAERPRQQCPCAKVGGSAVLGPGTEGKAFAALWGRALGARSGPGGKRRVILPLAKLSFLGPVTLGPLALPPWVPCAIC